MVYDLGVIGAGVAVSKAAPAIAGIGRVAISYMPGWPSDPPTTFDFFPDMKQLMKEGLVRSLYIATPVNTHFHFIEQALSFGIPALVEKPATKTLKEAVAVSARGASKVAVAFKKRYSVAARHIVSARQKAPKDRCLISYTWLAPHPGPNHWKLSAGVAGGGVLMDVGSHIIDLFSFAVGPIATVRIARVLIDNLHGTESALELNVNFANGSEGEIVIGWADGQPTQRLCFAQRDTQVTWTKDSKDHNGRLEIINDSENICIMDDPSTEYVALFRQFAAFANGLPAEIPSWDEGMENMRIIDSVYQQLAEYRML